MQFLILGRQGFSLLDNFERVVSEWYELSYEQLMWNEKFYIFMINSKTERIIYALLSIFLSFCLLVLVLWPQFLR